MKNKLFFPEANSSLTEVTNYKIIKYSKDTRFEMQLNVR